MIKNSTLFFTQYKMRFLVSRVFQFLDHVENFKLACLNKQTKQQILKTNKCKKALFSSYRKKMIIERVFDYFDYKDLFEHSFINKTTLFLLKRLEQQTSDRILAGYKRKISGYDITVGSSCSLLSQYQCKNFKTKTEYKLYKRIAARYLYQNYQDLTNPYQFDLYRYGVMYECLFYLFRNSSNQKFIWSLMGRYNNLQDPNSPHLKLLYRLKKLPSEVRMSDVHFDNSFAKEFTCFCKTIRVSDFRVISQKFDKITLDLYRMLERDSEFLLSDKGHDNYSMFSFIKDLSLTNLVWNNDFEDYSSSTRVNLTPFEVLNRVLERCENIETLDLSGCRFPKVETWITPYLKSSNCKIKVIKMNNVTFSDDSLGDFLKYLLQGLKDCKTLEKLELGQLHLSDELVKELFSQIFNTRNNLVYLDILDSAFDEGYLEHENLTIRLSKSSIKRFVELLNKP